MVIAFWSSILSMSRHFNVNWVELYELTIQNMFYSSGAVEHKIVLPDITNTTSAAFGGPRMNELFVTTGFSGIESMRETAGFTYKIIFKSRHIRGTELFKAELWVWVMNFPPTLQFQFNFNVLENQLVTEIKIRHNLTIIWGDCISITPFSTKKIKSLDFLWIFINVNKLNLSITTRL